MPQRGLRSWRFIAGSSPSNAALVKRGLPELLESLIEQPLLYVPLNNDGEPEQVRAAQSLQSLIRFLVDATAPPGSVAGDLDAC